MNPRRLGVLAVASFALFVGLALGVKASTGLDSWDLQAAIAINQLSVGGFLNSLLVDASRYGREYFWIPLVIILYLFGDRRTKLVALGLSGVFLLGIVGGTLAKDLVARPRPWAEFQAGYQLCNCTLRLPVDTDYSFPSGHALIVSIGAVYSLLAFRRKWLAGLLTVEAAVVCFSRVYTFEHFPTDVLGGVALGAAISLGGYLLGRRYLTGIANRAAVYLVKWFRDGRLQV